MPGKQASHEIGPLTQRRDEVKLLDQRPALACVSTATVVRDRDQTTPYEIVGDVVGYVCGADEEGFGLVGWSFATRVRYEDLRAIWRREDAPDPCPHCGGIG